MNRLLIIIACFVTVSVPVIVAGENHVKTNRRLADVYVSIKPAAGVAGVSNEVKYTQGNNDFAFALYGRLAQGSKGNIFFSPYSISSALAMTYNGAKGDTAKQMAQVLHFSTDTARLNKEIYEANKALASRGLMLDAVNAFSTQKDYEFDVANALWGQKDYVFLEPFLANMRTYYGAALNKVDFKNDAEGALSTINHWVGDKTKDKIPELIGPGALDKSIRLILTDAIYFKSLWLLPFKKEHTRKSNFYVNDSKVTKTELMFQCDKEFSYCELEGVQALSLPYKGDLAMLVVLPDKKLGVAEVDKKINGRLFTSLVSGLQRKNAEVFLPKFKSESEFELAPMLSSMGMPDAFIESAADFSAMTGNKDLYISQVIHKAVVDVYEEGTEAVAATVVAMCPTAAPVRNPPVVFRADHPFIYFIYDTRTNMIIFMGRMTDPGEK